MEKKTIGSFIAALRKANGMTQKQLAELLNVSDKSVSRWERDECAPDLALIPVMAEIFGVSSDELLRGQRKNPDAQPQYEEKKTEKQLRRLLSDARSRLQIRSILSLSVALLGLIAAMICNLGFLRGYLGFFVGLAFLLAAGVMEAIFLIQSHHAVDGGDFDSSAICDHRKSMADLACLTYGAVITLFWVILPLLLIPWDPYQGLEGGSWLGYGLLYGGIGGLGSVLLSWLVRSRLVKAGFLAGGPFEEAKSRLRKKVLKTGLVILLITGLCSWAFSQFTSATTFVSGTVFHNWEDFKAYMETPTDYDGNGMSIGSGETFSSDVTYITSDGSYIFPDEITEETVVGRHGEVLCSYRNLNLNVVEIHPGNGEDDLLPVAVYTNTDRIRGMNIRSSIQVGFSLLFLAEIIILTVYYGRKVRKMQ